MKNDLLSTLETVVELGEPKRALGLALYSDFQAITCDFICC